MAIEHCKNIMISETQCKLEHGYYKYRDILSLTSVPLEIYVGDHLGGFDENLTNFLLDHLSTGATNNCIVWADQIFNANVRANYPNLKFKLNFPNWLWKSLADYNIHPNIQYKNFICSFNGSAHISRKLLVSILKKFGYFDPAYSSKNFCYSVEILSGHINNYVPTQESFYNKFFISDTSENFFQSTNSFGHVRFTHNQNIYNLESKLTESFLHIVSETMATSYQPFVTEKFLYSVVTRGLFLAYAQPGWHKHIEKYYGFKLYTKLFNYNFDSIQNPVERLVELMTMISKFSYLSPIDWRDLYLLEQDTIEYNYNHYFSGNYLKSLTNYQNTQIC